MSKITGKNTQYPKTPIDPMSMQNLIVHSAKMGRKGRKLKNCPIFKNEGCKIMRKRFGGKFVK